MKKVGVLGAKKRGKTFAGREFGKEFFKQYVGGNILSVEGDFIVEDFFRFDKRVKVLCRYGLHIIYLFLYILRFSTEMIGTNAEDTFEHYPSTIL